jgi:hypothetical protein
MKHPRGEPLLDLDALGLGLLFGEARPSHLSQAFPFACIQAKPIVVPHAGFQAAAI